MASPITNDAILDAAEAIVAASGAAHMTLDAVAERAGVSKGGLMYRFPSKMALLQAMLGRLIESVEAQREQIRAELADQKPNELEIEVLLLSRLDNECAKPMVALLAAVANEPGLMAPFREEMRRRLADRLAGGGMRGRVIFLAALGLHFSHLLDIPVLDDAARATTYDELRRLAANPRAKF